MVRFLFRAQDHNMTNGDFAFFTFDALRSFSTDRPWTGYGFRVDDPDDLPRRRRAFHAVKQVLTYICYFINPSCLQLNIPSKGRVYPLQVVGKNLEGTK